MCVWLRPLKTTSSTIVLPTRFFDSSTLVGDSDSESLLTESKRKASERLYFLGGLRDHSSDKNLAKAGLDPDLDLMAAQHTHSKHELNMPLECNTKHCT